MISAVSCSATSVLQQLEDLRLDRHVERGRRLVGDQELRLAGQRHRDHRALPHPAGELVRVVLQALSLALGIPTWSSSSTAAAVRLARGPCRSASRGARGSAGRSSAPGSGEVIGSWKIIAISRPRIARSCSSFSVRAGRWPPNIARAAGDAAVAGEDPEQCERGDALPAARLADDPERLARRDVEGDPVDGVDEPAARPELDVEVLDGEERLSSHVHAASGREPRAGRRRSG